MIKSILVASGGGASDMPVLETALAAAHPLAAHLEVFHLQPRLGEATICTPHADMAMGSGISSALDQVETDINRRSRASERHFDEFCLRHHIEIRDRAVRSEKVTASWREVQGDSLECLSFAARHHDLLIASRPSVPNGLPKDLIELVILRTGCPVLVAPVSARHSITGTVLVAWKECAEAGRALAAALPLLVKAERVILIGVQEDDPSTAGMLQAGLQDTVHRLAWHGIDVEQQFIQAEGRLAAEVISAAAQTSGAGLIVMGAYGRSRISEVLFGGCTQYFIEDETAAVLFAH